MNVWRAARAGYFGRPHLEYKAEFTYQRVGDLSTEMIEHFSAHSLTRWASLLHLKTKGKNDHPPCRGLFKITLVVRYP